MPYGCDISVIIVSYNCLESLKACLESLGDEQGVRSEILVFDNASSDGTASFLDSQRFKHIKSDKNLGFGAAVNRTSDRAEGRFLFILNPDTIVPPSSLSRLLKYAEDNPSTGIVAPALHHPDGRLQLSARKFPRRRDILVGRGSPLSHLGLADEEKAGYITTMEDGPVEIPAVSATAILMEKGFLRELGGFDERFFMYMEDLDLCRRIKDKKRKIVMLPAVSVIHSWRQSSRNRPYFTSYHHHLSIYKYFAKHYPRQVARNLMLLIFLAAGLCVAFLFHLLRLGGRR